MVGLTVNGRALDFDLDPDTPLLVGACAMRPISPARNMAAERAIAAPAWCLVDGDELA